MNNEDSLRFRRTQDAVRNNDPPIEINQRWIAYVDGEVFRRIRILAKHPDGDWITCDEPAKMKRFNYGPYDMQSCPEFNLRYVFELEKS